jgi:multidrug resistance efflux pump
MQYHMSTAPGLAPQPSAPTTTPEVVQPAAQPPKKRGILLLVLLVVIGAAAAWWFFARPAADAAAAQNAAAVALRTSTVTQGNVLKTLRLTGNTSAERYASLLVPQLRGSRAETLRSGKTFPSPGASYPISSNAGGSGSGVQGGGSAISTGSNSGGSGGGDTQVASTMGQSSSTSSALRSATSRVSSGSRSSRGNTSGSSAPSTGSESSLGSTSGQLLGSGGGGGGGGGGGSTSGGGGGGGGRGGGGGGDFQMVLQSAAKAGVFVKKGTPVAEFDRQFMMLRLDDYRAAYAQMEASFRKLEAEMDVQRKIRRTNIDNAKSDLEKARLDLKTLPVMGEMDTERLKIAAEEAEANYKQQVAALKFYEISYQAQVKASRLELEQAKLELQRAEANAERMILKAPIDGLVVMQTMRRGTEFAQIQAGDQLWAGMRFMQIVDPSSMVVTAYVNQVDAEAIRVGADATVHFDAFPGLSLPAKVHAIGAMTRPGMMRASFVRDIPVVLKIARMDSRVIPDLSVSVDVELEKDAAAPAVVPLASVFRDGSTRQPYVFVRNGDRWQRREVELGLFNNLVVAVRSGLRPGEVVAAEYPPVTDRKQGQL